MFQRLLYKLNTDRERRIRMIYRQLRSYEETDELHSVSQLRMDVSYHPLVVLWIQFQRFCNCTSVRACNLAEVRITGNVSYGILQITKIEARKSEVIFLCDK